MDSPRQTSLYKQIAKDFRPKEAMMQMCRYIEGLEKRIETLEAASPAKASTEKPVREAKPKPAPAPKVETTNESAPEAE